MSDVAALLPSNRTPLEAALEQITSPTADPSVIRTIHDPMAAPAVLLPWLAWSHDVPIWPSAAPEAVKRSLIKNSEYYHRIAGTLAGFRTMARLADGELIRWVRPPSKTFAGKSLTKGERNAWVSRHPEIRWYRYLTRSTRRHAMFGRSSFAGAMSFCITDAIDRIGQRAFFVRDGAETPISHHVIETVSQEKRAIETHQAALPGTAGRATWAGLFTRYLINNGASARLYSVTLDDAYIDRASALRRQTITPGMNPISVLYDTIADRSTRRRHVFGNMDFIGAMFPSVTDAAHRLYRSIRLHDPNLRPERRGRSTHIGATRLGMPHHNGELMVRFQRSAFNRGIYLGRHLRGFFIKPDRSGYNRLFQALRFSRRASEKILVTTTTRLPLPCSNQHLAGSLICGEWG